MPRAAHSQQPPAPKPAAQPAPPAADRPPPGPDAVSPEPPEEDAIFRALLDAGVGPVVAYTAEKRLNTMISEAIAPQLQPFLLEMTRRFDERFDRIERRLDELAQAGAERDRRLDELSKAVTEHDRKLDGIDRRLNEHDRKLAVLAARMQLLFGAMGLLVTVLIAVFGFLVATSN